MDEFDRHYLEKAIIEASIRVRKNQLEGYRKVTEGIGILGSIERQEKWRQEQIEERNGVIEWEKAVDALMEAEKNEKISQGRQSEIEQQSDTA